MSLTGHAMPVVLGLLALVLLTLLVLGRPRWRNSYVAGTFRGLVALGMNLVVVLLAGVLLNDKYAFYVSWDDLMGVTGPTVQATGGGTPEQVVKAKVQGAGFAGMSTPTHLPALPDPKSRLQQFTVTGSQSGMRNKVWVYLPQGYDPTKARTYPVVEALHGYPSRATVFQHINGFFSGFDQAVAEHKMAPSIIVMPDINPGANTDTECVNATGGYQTETWIAHDVPEWVVGHFRVKTERTAWASYGFSYGGWCAAVLGVRHPDIFAAAVIMQGYFRPDFDPSYEPFKPGSPQYRSYDLVNVARQHPPAVALWILASKQDSLSYPSTNALVKDARKPLYVKANLLKEGGHREAVWVPKIPDSLAWLGKTLPGFAPSGS